ncbi:hypothetical protein GLOTRDRAFT_139460 [Gloeophyllum trabeum ATCC 11539]|uniref:T6SS Phospholipase effector Tle1-like catalytic domain-containing protein n=1 Tax=Gloeophyllum trabeum (strain ATCC 11539 / FP-39264 / Madison 617) TaxID=670483 RepID=S7Q3C7_GLOTA|nr:uncharacterized protein GLOTRDRAFT_139460 [Gloeophyllum trabeum ATCC 11539]EPQ54047.1 hypothetical protein GLOTRDRAFT_139460 [Gloeophyllum trabeum ATCC 11539]
MNPLVAPAVPEPQSRTLCLCFDGTGNKFGETTFVAIARVVRLIQHQNSNVVRFFRALIKDNPEQQLPYYQAGIGTYNKREFHTRTLTHLSSALDQAVALHLNDHVKDGYTFLMRNYRSGDKICLVGFSRGAYTARALAGMLYKQVGLLPPDNEQQVDFAFTMYQSTDISSAMTSKEFKDTFCMDVKVDFLGVWDTVSSVGIIPRALPYSAACYNVTTFRHALALDERRARFRPNIWGEPTVREEVLDHDIQIELPEPDKRDDWVYEPIDRGVDVKEVWFSGCHADVGGGSHRTEEQESLSNITLRWMIKECRSSKVGLFDKVYLKDIGIDLDTDTSTDPRMNPNPESSGPPLHTLMLSRSDLHALLHPKDYIDALAWIYDQLNSVRFWWFLEYIPMLQTYQKVDGTWLRHRLPNYGGGRIIPHRNQTVLVHSSVRERMDKSQYQPKAQNWRDISDADMIRWVD